MMRIFACFSAAVLAERSADRVTSLPGFPESETWGFKAYSGILDVPGWGAEYHALKIHYQFHTSRRNPTEDPVTVWHQGGPGGSSITVGLYNELGALTVGREGNYVNENAWNQVSNMLFLESPAGSGQRFGFSQCLDNNNSAVTCSWDDTSQAEAYAHTLTTFFKEFPEYGESDLYLTGESYFGQYGPNIANFILNTKPFSQHLKLKGIALGNSCWGGNETRADCTGPNPDKNAVDFFHGRNLFSNKLYKTIMENCDFPDIEPNECFLPIYNMMSEVGPHNVYNIYDNCEETTKFLQRTGKDMLWLRRTLHGGMHEPHKTRETLIDMNGGYPWDCMSKASNWIVREDVRKALHLDLEPGASQFSYANHGPASQTLYPELAKKIRILIYSGDADACIPITSTEDQIADLEEKGAIVESAPWAPWYANADATIPVGYLTKFAVPDSEMDFTFATIRLAGHMAPQFQPKATLALMSSFFTGDWSAIQPLTSVVV